MLPRSVMAAFWAGLLALDFTGWGPWMLSQPLVCGPIFGWLMGQLAVGIIIGGLVQLLWLDVTPVGVGIPYDSMAVTVLAIYWGTLSEHSSFAQMIWALILAVPFGIIFQRMDMVSRRLNTWIAHKIEKVSNERLPLFLTLGILGGLFWSWLRYVAFYLAAMAIGQKVWMYLASSPRLTWMDEGLTMSLLLLPVAGMGVALELFLTDSSDRAPGSRSGQGRKERLS